MALWLIKSEPAAWSWADQVRDGTTAWTGVRNHQASRNLRTMQIGDQAMFYHSVTGKEIVGIVRVTRTAYPDLTDSDGRWICVDVTTDRPLPRPVTLAEIKATPALAEIPLIRQSRLSVMPLSEEHWTLLCHMAGAEPAL